MNLSELAPNSGATRQRKRVGRGPGSGHGKTAGRGTKGDKARGRVHPRFEGGQTPLHRRLPRFRGFHQPIKLEYATLNVNKLDIFDDGNHVTPEVLLARKICGDLKDGIKILGDGILTKRLNVEAHKFSAAARDKIEALGGTATEIPKRTYWRGAAKHNSTVEDAIRQLPAKNLSPAGTAAHSKVDVPEVKMGSITLNALFTKEELAALAIPVSARNAQTRKRERRITVDGGTLTLPIGDYLLAATLPSSEERTGIARVLERQIASVLEVVRVSEEWLIPEGTSSVFDTLLGNTWISLPVYGVPDQVTYGNIWTSKSIAVQSIEAWNGEKTGIATTSVFGRSYPQFLRVRTPEAVTPQIRAVGLPIFGSGACELRIISDQAGDAYIDVRLGSLIADSLLRYLDHEEYSYLRDFIVLNQRLIEDTIKKCADPAPLVAIAYALIKADQSIERLGAIVNRLQEMVPMGDVGVILAEYYSRLREDREAAFWLCKLRDYGPPVFSRGVRLAMNLCRILLYSDSLIGTSRTDLSETMGSLELYATRADLRLPLVCLYYDDFVS